MKIDDATVRNIAHLARIKVSDAEARTLEGELNGIRPLWLASLATAEHVRGSSGALGDRGISLPFPTFRRGGYALRSIYPSDNSSKVWLVV